jgi:hypothetical protein
VGLYSGRWPIPLVGRHKCLAILAADSIGQAVCVPFLQGLQDLLEPGLLSCLRSFEVKLEIAGTAVLLHLLKHLLTDLHVIIGILLGFVGYMSLVADRMGRMSLLRVQCLRRREIVLAICRCLRRCLSPSKMCWRLLGVNDEPW